MQYIQWPTDPDKGNFDMLEKKIRNKAEVSTFFFLEIFEIFFDRNTTDWIKNNSLIFPSLRKKKPEI